MKLNIGCGWNKKEGFVNIDKADEVEPDELINIENGLPYEDDTFIKIFSSHTLEHVRPHYWELVLAEMARVSKNGATWELILPFDNIWTRTNANHYRTFSFTSFAQYCGGSRLYYCKGWALRDKTEYPKRWIRAFFILFPFLKDEIKFEFEVVK